MVESNVAPQRLKLLEHLERLERLEPSKILRKIMLEVENLEVSYGALAALHGVSLTVGSGEMVALVGPNGAGKSTLLKTIAGLIAPRGGTIHWEGKRLDTEPTERIVEQGVALVPEGRHLFGRMTVRENLEIGAFTKRAQKERRDQMERVFTIFPRLRERAYQLAGLLSGGEQQMLALGRALMGLPRLLLLDESSIGLAPRVVESIFSILAELHQSGMSLLIVEQSVHTVLALAQRAYILEGGKMVGEGEAQILLKDDHVRMAYLGPLARGAAS
jgi:branched-chain amino acid transport system ATP-binding protein